MVTGGHAYPNAPGKHFILERGNNKWSGVQTFGVEQREMPLEEA